MQIINDRLDLVGMLLKQPELKDRIIALLRRCHDSQRLVQKFALGRGDPEDLLGLCSTILATHELVLSVEEALASEKDIENASKGFALQKLITRIQLDGPIALANKVRDAIDEEGLNQKHEAEDTEAETIIAFAEQIASAEGSPEEIVAMAKGRGRKRPSSLREHYVENSDLWIMKPMASSTLKRLHRELELLEIDKIRLGQDLQRRLKVASLTLRWTPGLGHICHIKGKDVQSLGEVRSVSASKSTRSFHQSEWTQLGQRIDQIKLQIRTEEQRVFQNLRQKVIVNIIKLRRNSAVLDELDVACSFATLAKEETLTRPILNNTTIHKIVGGRHPTVQGGLHQEGRSFVSNDCFVGDEARVWIITGPNMGGKSTFLRQNALITIMAQVGSYVPAEFAEIGIVDQIFSRVGSADDLYRNQSTFMVEMLETAVILRNATSRSFVIMDEIGRGTTPDDGTAIAFACLHHLYHISKCRTLFATHFHALAEMSEQREMKRVAFWCSDIAEDKDGGFSYLHKLRKGVNKQSHALKVARLAGIPETAIDLAQEILDEKAPGMES
jgi:DNA mismatch repair ATPase MutS